MRAKTSYDLPKRNTWLLTCRDDLTNIQLHTWFTFLMTSYCALSPKLSLVSK